MRECSFIAVLLCMLALPCTYQISKRFSPSDKSIQTNRKSKMKKTKCNKNKMMAKRLRQKKKRSKRKWTIAPTTPPLVTSYVENKSLFTIFAPRLLIENVSKSNYSAMLLTEYDEVHTLSRGRARTTSYVIATMTSKKRSKKSNRRWTEAV